MPSTAVVAVRLAEGLVISGRSTLVVARYSASIRQAPVRLSDVIHVRNTPLYTWIERHGSKQDNL
jgi:hypothetical protein